MWLWSRLEVACKWLAGGYVHHAYTMRTPCVHHAYTMRTPSVHHPYSRRTPYQQAMGWPWGAFEAALGWLCCRFGWLCSAFPHSALRIPHSPQGVFHKHPEYSSPYPPPAAWSGGTLVPPWYLPIPIGHQKSSHFNQASLSKSHSSSPSDERRFSGLDAGGCTLGV